VVHLYGNNLTVSVEWEEGIKKQLTFAAIHKWYLTHSATSLWKYYLTHSAALLDGRVTFKYLPSSYIPFSTIN
jgi:hypothetical protein